jgi:putative effector of murein hydrolase LrgA (UPF0299 family)
MFLSIRRGILAGVLALALVYYAFNFVPRNIAVMASRSFSWRVSDYLINFLLFFIGFYLLMTLVAWVVKKVSTKSK